MNQHHQTTAHQMMERMKARLTSLTFHQLCFQMKLAHPNKEYTAYTPGVPNPITLNTPELKEMQNKNGRDRGFKGKNCLNTSKCTSSTTH
eukprot:7020736-Ditylum_brightwellii.AAC.1